MALLTLMKSQPLAYNKDNQEDKEALFAVSTVKTASAHLRIWSQQSAQQRAEPGNWRLFHRNRLADYLVH